MDDFGSRSNSVSTQSGSLSLVPSKELSSVIVDAFSTAFNQFNQQNNYAINNNNISGNLTGGMADTSIAEYYKNLLRQSLEKEEKQKKKDAEEKKKKEAEQREREWKEYEKNAQTVLNEMSKWASNPLQGVSDLIDSGFTKMFAGIQKAWNTPISEVGKKFEAGVHKAFTPFTAVAGAIKAFSEVAEEKSDELEDVDMDGLLESSSKQASKSEQDAAKQQIKETNEQNEQNTKEIVNATDGVGLTVGGLFLKYIVPIATGVGLAVVALEILSGKFAEFIYGFVNVKLPLLGAELKKWLDDLKFEFQNFLDTELFPLLPGYNADKAAEKKLDKERKRLEKELEKLEKATPQQIKFARNQLEQEMLTYQSNLENAESDSERAEYMKRYKEAELRLKESMELYGEDLEFLENEKQKRKEQLDNIGKIKSEATAWAQKTGLSPSEYIKSAVYQQQKEGTQQEYERAAAKVFTELQSRDTAGFYYTQDHVHEYGENVAKQVLSQEVDVKTLKKATGVGATMLKGQDVEHSIGTTFTNIYNNTWGGGSTSPVAFRYN